MFRNLSNPKPLSYTFWDMGSFYRNANKISIDDLDLHPKHLKSIYFLVQGLESVKKNKAIRGEVNIFLDGCMNEKREMGEKDKTALHLSAMLSNLWKSHAIAHFPLLSHFSSIFSVLANWDQKCSIYLPHLSEKMFKSLFKSLSKENYSNDTNLIFSNNIWSINQKMMQVLVNFIKNHSSTSKLTLNFNSDIQFVNKENVYLLINAWAEAPSNITLNFRTKDNDIKAALEKAKNTRYQRKLHQVTKPNHS